MENEEEQWAMEFQPCSLLAILVEASYIVEYMYLKIIDKQIIMYFDIFPKV